MFLRLKPGRNPWKGPWLPEYRAMIQGRRRRRAAMVDASGVGISRRMQCHALALSRQELLDIDVICNRDPRLGCFFASRSVAVSATEDLGISLCTATIYGDKFLVAFGGYNGKYNNEVFVLKPKPRNIIQPRLFQSPATAAAAASVTAAYALTASGGRATDHIYTEDTISTTTQVESLPEVSAPDTDAMRTENKMLESKLVEVRDENTRLKGNLDELNNTFSELSMELQSIRGQLASESSRCFKLEVQIADMHKKLDSLSSIEHELESLRQQKSKAEQDMVVPKRQHSGGVWQWVTGSA